MTGPEYSPGDAGNQPATWRWPMIGRRQELASILEGVHRRVGTVVVGEPGVGKTMLLREVQQRVEADGRPCDLVLCSRFSDLSMQALAPMIDADTASGPAVLVVDDAHVLDDESADLLWRLASTGRAVVVAAVRAGEAVPERVARLWADGACERLDLAPLNEDDVRALLELVLEGDVEDRLAHLLVVRASGNALLLRELTRSGLTSGAIARSHEVWRLVGELPVGAGVAELIRRGLDVLNADELHAVEMLAMAEPLALEIAHSEMGDQLVDALEAKRVVALQHTADGAVLTLAHPLYGEVVRAGIGPLRRRRLRLALVDAIGKLVAPSPRELLRSALWRLELGETVRAEELIAAARLARSSAVATAERLARAAVDECGTTESVLLLAEILTMQGRVVETDRLLDGIDLSSLDELERDAVIYVRAMGRTRVGELGSVAALLEDGAASASDNPVQLQAVYAQSLMLDGRIDESFAALRPLYDDPASGPLARTLAACGLVAGGALSGKLDESERIMRAAIPEAEKVCGELPYGLGTVTVAGAICVANSGRLDIAEEIGRQMYERALRDDDQWLRPRGASALGVVALGRGMARTATRWFRITVASLNEFDRLFLRYNLTFLARAAALAGFVDEARAALDAPDDAPRLRFFDADWELAEAAVMAADGVIGGARNHALGAARRAASLGQWSVVLAAAHDAARYSPSKEAAELARVAAEHVDGPLSQILADHAEGRARNDATRLADVSARFEALGWTLFACEAAYASAHAFQGKADGRAAALVAVRAADLYSRCENARIPWVSRSRITGALTPREHEVALLAAAGHSDAEIAARLDIAVRTVQNHLARAYPKIGVTSRRDLPTAFGGSYATDSV